MSHTTCTQGNWGDSQLLMVWSQIANLTPNLSFSHNFCFKCPNGSCKPILDIYVLIAFQWYKEIFGPMCFDPCNCSLKIQKSITTLTPKVGVHLGMWGSISSHSPTLPRAWNVTPGLPSRPAPLQAFALVVSPRLGLRHWWLKGWETHKWKMKWGHITWTSQKLDWEWHYSSSSFLPFHMPSLM